MAVPSEAETVRPRRMHEPRPTPMGFALAPPPPATPTTPTGGGPPGGAPDLSSFDDPLGDLEGFAPEATGLEIAPSDVPVRSSNATVRAPPGNVETSAGVRTRGAFDQAMPRVHDPMPTARLPSRPGALVDASQQTRELLDFDFDAAFADSPVSSAPAGGADALALVSRREEPSRPSPDPLAELRERYALGDFSGALTIAESILEGQPELDAVLRYAESCRGVLQQMYAARLGPLGQVPLMAVPAEQLRWLTLDHRSGFLLSHVDGVSTLEEILDVAGMPNIEAMRILCELVQQRVIILQ